MVSNIDSRFSVNKEWVVLNFLLQIIMYLPSLLQ